MANRRGNSQQRRGWQRQWLSAMLLLLVGCAGWLLLWGVPPATLLHAQAQGDSAAGDAPAAEEKKEPERTSFSVDLRFPKEYDDQLNWQTRHNLQSLLGVSVVVKLKHKVNDREYHWANCGRRTWDRFWSKASGVTPLEGGHWEFAPTHFEGASYSLAVNSRTEIEALTPITFKDGHIDFGTVYLPSLQLASGARFVPYKGRLLDDAGKVLDTVDALSLGVKLDRWGDGGEFAEEMMESWDTQTIIPNSAGRFFTLLYIPAGLGESTVRRSPLHLTRPGTGIAVADVKVMAIDDASNVRDLHDIKLKEQFVQVDFDRTDLKEALPRLRDLFAAGVRDGEKATEVDTETLLKRTAVEVWFTNGFPSDEISLDAKGDKGARILIASEAKAAVELQGKLTIYGEEDLTFPLIGTRVNAGPRAGPVVKMKPDLTMTTLVAHDVSAETPLPVTALHMASLRQLSAQLGLDLGRDDAMDRIAPVLASMSGAWTPAPDHAMVEWRFVGGGDFTGGAGMQIPVVRELPLLLNSNSFDVYPLRGEPCVAWSHEFAHHNFTWAGPSTHMQLEVSKRWERSDDAGMSEITIDLSKLRTPSRGRGGARNEVDMRGFRLKRFTLHWIDANGQDGAQELVLTASQRMVTRLRLPPGDTRFWVTHASGQEWYGIADRVVCTDVHASLAGDTLNQVTLPLREELNDRTPATALQVGATCGGRTVDLSAEVATGVDGDGSVVVRHALKDHLKSYPSSIRLDPFGTCDELPLFLEDGEDTARRIPFVLQDAKRPAGPVVAKLPERVTISVDPKSDAWVAKYGGGYGQLIVSLFTESTKCDADFIQQGDWPVRSVSLWAPPGEATFCIRWGDFVLHTGVLAIAAAGEPVQFALGDLLAGCVKQSFDRSGNYGWGPDEATVRAWHITSVSSGQSSLCSPVMFLPPGDYKLWCSTTGKTIYHSITEAMLRRAGGAPTLQLPDSFAYVGDSHVLPVPEGMHGDWRQLSVVSLMQEPRSNSDQVFGQIEWRHGSVEQGTAGTVNVSPTFIPGALMVVAMTDSMHTPWYGAGRLRRDGNGQRLEDFAWQRGLFATELSDQAWTRPLWMLARDGEDKLLVLECRTTWGSASRVHGPRFAGVEIWPPGISSVVLAGPDMVPKAEIVVSENSESGAYELSAESRRTLEAMGLLKALR